MTELTQDLETDLRMPFKGHILPVSTAITRWPGSSRENPKPSSPQPFDFSYAARQEMWCPV